jgi:hypothetical protein
MYESITREFRIKGEVRVRTNVEDKVAAARRCGETLSRVSKPRCGAIV